MLLVSINDVGCLPVSGSMVRCALVRHPALPLLESKLVRQAESVISIDFLTY
jgi:hypothetical protein